MTEGLAPEDARSADTSRVSLAEMESILRSQEDGHRSTLIRSTPRPRTSQHSAVTRPDLPATKTKS